MKMQSLAAFAITCATLAPAASAEWLINDVGVAVTMEADSYDKFMAVAKCGDLNVMALYDLKNYKASGVGNVLNVKLRVDRGEILTTHGTLTEDNSNVALVIEDGEKLIPAMKRGANLRVAFKAENQGFDIIERYPLDGFTNAYRKSEDKCLNETREYFPDDGDFF